VLPCYFPPITMTTNPHTVYEQVTGNGVYLYESLITPDSELFRLPSFTNAIRYVNLKQLPIVITLSVPASASVTKYAFRAGVSSISPSD